MATDFDEFDERDGLLAFTVEIVTAHVSHNSVAMADVPQFIHNVHHALAGLAAPAEPAEAKATPIMDPKKSVKPDHITCLECGRKTKMLRAHLSTQHNLTPAEYRAKYELPPTYPMVAPNVRAAYSERAVRMGLSERMQKARKAKAAKPAARPTLKAVGHK